MFPDAPLMTVDDVAALTKPGEQVVTAIPWFAAGLNDIEPRLMGQGSDAVWVVRAISGAHDSDGTAPGVVILVSDSTGSVVTTLPLALEAGYETARLVLDTKSQAGGMFQDYFSIKVDERLIAQGFLGSSLTPFALAPGIYTVHAWSGTGAITHPPTGPECDLELTLEGGDDVSHYARWPGGADCVWKQGSPFEGGS
jgi:hypothetical protein